MTDQPKRGLKRNFFSVALRDFIHVGGIFPSSRYTIRALLKHLPQDAGHVVEYGPGDGVITKEILKKLSAQGKLHGIELNPDFVQTLKHISDPRFEVIAGNVIEWSARLQEFSPQGVDAVYSGIPFSFLPVEARDKVVQNTYRGLRAGGRFIVYQYSRLMLPFLKNHFRNVSCHYEIRNIFPYHIMVGEKES